MSMFGNIGTQTANVKQPDKHGSYYSSYLEGYRSAQVVMRSLSAAAPRAYCPSDVVEG
jgi:hypothetical protein